MTRRQRIIYLLARLEGALGCAPADDIQRPDRSREPAVDEERTMPALYPWVTSPEVH